MRVTATRGALSLLVVVGLFLYAGGKWGGEAGRQESVQRDWFAGPERTFDDRRKHTIRLVVRYRPARQLTIVWGIGERGGTDRRMPGDRMEWEKSGEVWDGAPSNVLADNFDRGGYLYCAIEQDGEIVREYREERTEHNDFCDLAFVAGGR